MTLKLRSNDEALKISVHFPYNVFNFANKYAMIGQFWFSGITPGSIAGIRKKKIEKLNFATPLWHYYDGKPWISVGIFRNSVIVFGIPETLLGFQEDP